MGLSLLLCLVTEGRDAASCVTKVTVLGRSVSAAKRCYGERECDIAESLELVVLQLSGKNSTTTGFAILYDD